MILVLMPLACWLFAAPPGRVRTTVAAVLMALVLFTGATALGLLPFELRLTSLVLGLFLLAAVPLVGLVLAWPVHTGKGGRRRAFAATWTMAYTLLAGGGSAAYGLVLLVSGPPARVPPASALPAMPAGLRVATDRDGGCDRGSVVHCHRELTVAGAPDQDTTRVLDRLRGQLTSSGWPLTHHEEGPWVGCRTHGLLLDAHQVCATLTVTGSTATISLSATDTR
ncbi:hypothetical protein ACFV4P_24080 [Kitasatospora sp. NPDC059795]|uniref:hypothetical protein n=1 Tax=Kitasatospora sp. NPDC059795 TaxID=3346949 RepID=UPI003650F9F9